MIYDGDELKQALGLVYGALAQNLSDTAAVKHASWWTGVNKDELDQLVKSVHPAGLEHERETQKNLLPFEMIVHSEVNKIVDGVIKKNGMNDKSIHLLYTGITSFFERLDHGHSMECMRDRLLFWRKKTIWYVFQAGRAMPMTLRRRHYGAMDA
ncbi:hypothetical protein [Sphingobium sp. LSP13-1-1.1]|uniref:hypothetical protein n=1 Tax=Sphingobium sp. LSP13-1-1.1 TaxID=3135234 RepID=UPI00341C4F6B